MQLRLNVEIADVPSLQNTLSCKLSIEVVKVELQFFFFLFAFGLTIGILTWGNVHLAVDYLQLQKHGELYNHSEVFVMFYGFRRAEMALKKVTNPAAFYCPQGKEWIAIFYSTSTLRVAQMV